MICISHFAIQRIYVITLVLGIVVDSNGGNSNSNLSSSDFFNLLREHAILGAGARNAAARGRHVIATRAQPLPGNDCFYGFEICVLHGGFRCHAVQRARNQQLLHKRALCIIQQPRNIGGGSHVLGIVSLRRMATEPMNSILYWKAIQIYGKFLATCRTQMCPGKQSFELRLPHKCNPKTTCQLRAHIELSRATPQGRGTTM